MSKILNGNPITIGIPGTCSDKYRSFRITQNDTDRVIAVLPAGGPSAKLIAVNNCNNNPASLVSGFTGNTLTAVSPEVSQRQNDNRFKNTLLGQMITMKLNVAYNPSLGAMRIENNYINTQRSQDCDTGKNIGAGDWRSDAMPTVIKNYFGGVYTVNKLLAISDSLIAGASLAGSGTKPTLVDVNNALSSLVNAFHGCRILLSQTSTSLNSSLETNANELKDNINNNPLFDVAAYPNPLDQSTVISFILPAASKVSLRIYNANGVEISSLIDGSVEAGENAINWVAKDFPDGIYFYRIEATTLDNGESFSKSGKLVVNR